MGQVQKIREPEQTKTLTQFQRLLNADSKLFEAAEALTKAGLPHGAAHIDVVRLWVAQAISEIQDTAYDALALGLEGKAATKQARR